MSSDWGSFQRGLRRRTCELRSVRWLYSSLPAVMLTPLSMLCVSGQTGTRHPRVDRLDQLAVQVQPERLDLGVVLGNVKHTRDNVLAKVLVHEAGRAELDLVKSARAKDLGEPALVMVITVLRGVVHAADVDDNVQGVNWG